jgi:aspartyl-tRNA(Asn)/glutamyl-tRNA(Gln) amidotransferase subunit A
VRIPAAFCGLVGFKPTQARVPRDGASPLSSSLDSIGPLARSTEDCAVVDAIMAGEEPIIPEAIPVEALRLAVPQTIMLDAVEPAVAAAFERACAVLSRAGARLVDVKMPELGELPGLNARAASPAPRPMPGTPACSSGGAPNTTRGSAAASSAAARSRRRIMSSSSSGGLR